MPQPKVRLLLIAGFDQSKEAYERSLNALGAQYDTVNTVAEIESALMETPYNGLLLDVPTMIKAGNREKALVHELLERFPVLRLIHDPNTGEVRGLYYGRTVKDGASLEQFVNRTCAKFMPRSIRVARRVDKVLNVHLLDHPDTPVADGERTVTFNISVKGCFVFTTSERNLGDMVYIVFRDLGADQAVAAEIRWQVPWGESMRLPGLGVSFVDIPDKLLERLEAVL